MLLDSSALIWLLYEPNRLGAQTKQALQNADRVFVSVASLWELALKHAAGKLQYSPRDITADADASNVERMEMSDHHLLRYSRTDLPHNDPFDRMITTQAHLEGITLVTADRNLLASRYKTLDCTK